MAERSRAYPSYNLEECINSAKHIKDSLGKGKHTLEAIAEAMGYSPKNSGVSRRISSLVQFGLLEKHTKENSYSLIPGQIDKITHPKNNEEVITTVRELFYTPLLYAEIMGKYENDGQIPKILPNILYREHGITQSASQDAAKTFLESGIYAKVFDENNKIITDLSTTAIEDNSYRETEKEDRHTNITSPDIPSTKNTQFVSNLSGQNQTFSFALTGGKFAQLVVPTNLTTKDILIIRKQIELLELQVDEN